MKSYVQQDVTLPTFTLYPAVLLCKQSATVLQYIGTIVRTLYDLHVLCMNRHDVVIVKTFSVQVQKVTARKTDETMKLILGTVF